MRVREGRKKQETKNNGRLRENKREKNNIESNISLILLEVSNFASWEQDFPISLPFPFNAQKSEYS